MTHASQVPSLQTLFKLTHLFGLSHNVLWYFCIRLYNTQFKPQNIQVLPWSLHRPGQFSLCTTRLLILKALNLMLMLVSSACRPPSWTVAPPSPRDHCPLLPAPQAPQPAAPCLIRVEKIFWENCPKPFVSCRVETLRSSSFEILERFDFFSSVYVW